MSFCSAVWAIVKKDVLLEYRRKWLLVSAILFGFLFVIGFGIAFDGGRPAPELAAGVMWLILLYSCITVLLRTSSFEEERKAWYALYLAPVDRSAIFFGKCIANLIFLLIIDSVIVAAFWLLLGMSQMVISLHFLLTLIGGTFGLVETGTFLFFLTASSQGREILFPVAMIPLTIPLLIAVTKLTEGIWSHDLLNPMLWYTVMASYIILFTALSWLLFEWLVEV